MDPNYIRDKPGKSPMGMDLIPVYEDEQPPEPASSRSELRAELRRAHGEGAAGSIPVDIRTVGTLAYNDQHLALVTTKYDGWIEKVYVNYVGEPVKKGRCSSTSTARSWSPPSRSTCTPSTTRRRWPRRPIPPPPRAHARCSMPGRAAAVLGHQRRPDRRSYAQAGKSAHALRRLAGERSRRREDERGARGHAAAPGMQLYKIVDLSTIWVDVQIFENQIPWLKLGQRAYRGCPPNRRWTRA